MALFFGGLPIIVIICFRTNRTFKRNCIGSIFVNWRHFLPFLSYCGTFKLIFHCLSGILQSSIISHIKVSRLSIVALFWQVLWNLSKHKWMVDRLIRLHSCARIQTKNFLNKIFEIMWCFLSSEIVIQFFYFPINLAVVVSRKRAVSENHCIGNNAKSPHINFKRIFMLFYHFWGHVVGCSTDVEALPVLRFVECSQSEISKFEIEIFI